MNNFDKTHFSPGDIPVRVLNIPRETREVIIKKIAKAFEGHKYKGKTIEDSVLYARKLLARCVSGTTDDDKTWRRCPNRQGDSDEDLLKKRLRVLLFDLDTGERIQGKGRPRNRRKERQIAGLITNQNKEIIGKKNIKPYNAAQLLSGEEEKIFNKFKRDLYQEHPGLKDAIVDNLGVDMLAFQYVEIVRAQGLIADNKRSKTLNRDISGMMETYRKMTETLGISRKQREDQKKHRDDGSIANFVRQFEEKYNDDHWLELFIQYTIEEFHLIWEKYKRGEIEEWVPQFLFGRRVEFPTGNLAPIEMPWIQDILIKEGVLSRPET